MKITLEKSVMLCSIIGVAVNTSIAVVTHWSEIKLTFDQMRQNMSLLPMPKIDDPPGYAEAHRQLYDDLRTPEQWPLHPFGSH